MPKVYLMIGLPASGKSTYAKEHCKDGDVYVSRDEIRFSFLKDGESYFKHEKKVFKIFINTINQALAEGKNVWVDATHLNKVSRDKTVNGLVGYTEIIAVYMNTGIDICLMRNSKREGLRKVPDDVIKSMNCSLTFPDLKQEKNITNVIVNY